MLEGDLMPLLSLVLYTPCQMITTYRGQAPNIKHQAPAPRNTPWEYRPLAAFPHHMMSTQLLYIPLPWCPCIWAYAVVCLGHKFKESACRLYYPIIHCMFWRIRQPYWLFRYHSFKLSKLTSCHVSLLLFPVNIILDLQVRVWLSAAICFCHKRSRFS